LKSGISFFPVIPLLKTYKKCADCKRNRKKDPFFFFFTLRTFELLFFEFNELLFQPNFLIFKL